MRDIHYPGRSVAMSRNGMVATSHPMAVQTGLEVLKSGGNAMDAAVAASAALCVVEPQSTGIGGDCFILYHEAKTGTLHGLNGSGRAPAKATPEEYRRRGHTSVPERGILSVSVPGAIHAWEAALERFGTRGLDAALQPAITFAEDGYAVTPVVGSVWKRHEPLLSQDPTARKYMLVEGKAPATGTRHTQPALARTMRAIAREGSKGFYEGEVAKGIADYMREHGGLIEEADLAADRSEWVEPIHTDYRGLRVCEIPPNGQGITALMTLNILEQTRLGEQEHLSPDYIHTVSEAFKLAIAERDQYVADMNHADVPVAQMLDKGFAKRQWARIDPARALEHPVPSALNGHGNTVYITVVDRDGNCCSFINSLYKGFGSGVMAGETGVMLQNRAHGFVLEEGHFNCIAPGKRPLNTIIPAMVYRGGQPVLSFGVMGGHYQAMGHTYAFTNWLDFGMDLQEALDAPRFLAMDGELAVERPIGEATRQALRQRGHKVVEADMPHGGGQMIYIDHEAGVLHGASDARKDGCAMGY